MSDLISIIIPVHNAEDFLEESLHSVKQQTYRNTEIIILDDGSSDRSAEICRKHAAEDPRIRFMQFDERKGQGCRRNQGIDLAKGKYAAFLDADDAMAPSLIDTLYGMITKYQTEIAVCGFCTDHQYQTHESGSEILTDGRGAVKLFLTDPQFGAFSSNKLFLIDLLRTSGHYPEGMYYEDVVFIPQVCANAKRVAVTRQRLYFYRQHRNSTTMRRFDSAKMDQVHAYDMLIPVLQRKFPDLAKECSEKAFSAVMAIYTLMLSDGFHSDEYRNILLNHAKDYRQGFSLFGASGKLKALIFTLALSAPKLYKFLIRCFHRRY